MDSTPNKWHDAKFEKPRGVQAVIFYRAIGFIGVFLSFALITISLLLGYDKPVQPSISHYYYTHLREVFEGAMFCCSIFFFTYTGYGSLSDIVTARIAAFFALATALVPTCFLKDGHGQSEPWSLLIINDSKVSSTIHLISAGLFLLTLAYISFFIFTRSSLPPEKRSPEKIKRNKLYRTCAVLIVVFVVIAGVAPNDAEFPYILVAESFALLAFGVSWFTKGEVIFKDSPGVSK